MPRTDAIARAHTAARMGEMVVLLDYSRNIAAPALADVPGDPDATLWHIHPAHPNAALLIANSDLVVKILPPQQTAVAQ